MGPIAFGHGTARHARQLNYGSLKDSGRTESHSPGAVNRMLNRGGVRKSGGAAAYP
jgi:hypothetical protein